MAGNNLLVAASIAPGVIVSQALGTTEAAVYTTPAATSAKIRHGVLCNITGSLTPLSLATGTAGSGSLGAGTYKWVVTAVNAAGETLASNEVTATVGASASMPLTWAAVNGAVTYNVYRTAAGGATGTELKVSGSGTGVVTNSYTDVGNSTSGALPAASTFGQAIYVSVSVVNSGGTITDGTHRIINRYALAANDSLSLVPYLGEAMLGPGDVIAAFASIAGSVDIVLSGTVHT